MKNEFINKYSISKTLRFSLIPIGKTAENFDSKLLLIEDEKRAEEYIKVKGYMDRYYRSFNERILNSFCLNGVREYLSTATWYNIVIKRAIQYSKLRNNFSCKNGGE